MMIKYLQRKDTSTGRVLRRLLPAIVSVGLATVLLIILIPGELDSIYRGDITQRRESTDRFMRFSVDSPILEAEKAQFMKLDYFPVDKRYRVKGTLELIDDTPVFALATTGDTEDLFERYAWTRFKLLGVTYLMLVLRSLDTNVSNNLFLAFYDETNGDETYFGGRYINLYAEGDLTVTIDFNRAYNPYCVYDPSYICPIPPGENKLPVRIEAGERMYPLKTPS